jgi:hypothetical protein
VKAKYQELFNDYQLRLTNAPTPNLKKLYQKNLQELNEALEALTGGMSGVFKDDLPSSAPTYNAQDNNSKVAEDTKYGQNKNVSPSSAKPNTAEIENLKTNLNNTKKLQKGFLLASIVFLSSSALLLVLLIEKNKNAKQKETEIAALMQVKDSFTKLSNEIKPFENGKFKVKNFGDSPLSLVWLVITYKNSKGELLKH